MENSGQFARLKVARMLDREGYRPNVGIILVNTRNSEVFWGKRIRAFLAVCKGRIKRNESRNRYVP